MDWSASTPASRARRRPNNASDVCDESAVCLQTVSLSAHTSCRYPIRARRSLRSVSRLEQLRLAAAAAPASAAPALRIPRIISAPASSVGLRRRSGQKDVLPIGPRASRSAGWLARPSVRPVTVAPAGPINHGRLSASSCDAAALQPLRRCLFINRSTSVSPILDLRCLWPALPCRRRQLLLFTFFIVLVVYARYNKNKTKSRVTSDVKCNERNISFA